MYTSIILTGGVLTIEVRPGARTKVDRWNGLAMPMNTLFLLSMVAGIMRKFDYSYQTAGPVRDF